MPSHFPEIRAAEQNHLDYMFFDCIKFIHKVIRHRAELPKTKKKLSKSRFTHFASLLYLKPSFHNLLVKKILFEVYPPCLSSY